MKSLINKALGAVRRSYALPLVLIYGGLLVSLAASVAELFTGRRLVCDIIHVSGIVSWCAGMALASWHILDDRGYR